MIGRLAKLGGFAASIVTAALGLLGAGGTAIDERVNVSRRATLRGEYTVSAYCGRYGGTAVARHVTARAVANAGGRSVLLFDERKCKSVAEAVRRGVAYQKRRRAVRSLARA